MPPGHRPHRNARPRRDGAARGGPAGRPASPKAPRDAACGGDADGAIDVGETLAEVDVLAGHRALGRLVLAHARRRHVELALARADGAPARGAAARRRGGRRRSARLCRAGPGRRSSRSRRPMTSASCRTPSCAIAVRASRGARAAGTRDVAAPAREAGDEPRILRRHARRAADPPRARRITGLRPGQVALAEHGAPDRQSTLVPKPTRSAPSRTSLSACSPVWMPPSTLSSTRSRTPSSTSMSCTAGSTAAPARPRASGRRAWRRRCRRSRPRGAAGWRRR